MSINWLVFLTVTLVQYIIGALWFSVLFGKQWLHINHPEGLPTQEEMQRMGKEAGPVYGIQFVIQVVSNLALYYLAKNTAQTSWLGLALIVWIGFSVPVTMQNILWSDPKNKRKPEQIIIVASELLVLTAIAAWAFKTFA